MPQSGFLAWGERHQVALYLGAIAVGAAVGWLVPGSPGIEHAIEPSIALLLFVTFLGVPFGRIGAAFGDVRFLGAVGILNFVVVPIVVWGLSRIVAADDALLFGVLLVLLTPCIDYVIVFAGLAGGAAPKLVAAAPLLMLAQIVLLPVYLLLFIGPRAVDAIDVAPFLRAFLVLIVVPLAAAAIVQGFARRSTAVRRFENGALGAMVPLMMLVLAVVIASQIQAVGAQIGALVRVVPVYVGFVLVMVALGMLGARAARLDIPDSRALVFSGVTRNSLVVLPLALALPPPLALVPLVVVTQTLVELVAMVIMVRVVPLLIGRRET